MISTQPDTFGELSDLNGSVRFQFDERISENVAGGDLASAVSVSPQTGEVRVGHGRSSLTVSLEGGFQPGLVYRVALLPVVSDLFGNPMLNAFELVFSTGGDPGPTATVAGEVWDRITGQAVRGATVQAVGPDSLVHVAMADDQGVFAFRYLPTGDFLLTGYQDQDRDREPGSLESSGSLSAGVASGDTLLIEIPILAPDTTPAVAGSAQALDSVTIVVEFDDYLDPEAAVDEVDLSVTREVGGAPTIARLLHEIDYVRYVNDIADSLAVLDSIDAAARAEAAAEAAAAAADSAAAALPDSTADAADSVAVEPGLAPDTTSVDLGGDTAEPAADMTAQTVEAPPARATPPRLDRPPADDRPGVRPPGRRLVGLLDGPLQPGDYQVQAGSVVNINGLAGGGGEAQLIYEPPPPPGDSLDGAADAAAPDSAAAADPDSVTDPAAGADPAAPDSLGAGR